MGEFPRNDWRTVRVTVLMISVLPLIPAVCTSALSQVVRNAARIGRETVCEIISWFEEKDLQVSPVRWHDGR